MSSSYNDVLKTQLVIANQEYRELKVEVQEKAGANRGRIDALSRGAQEDFEGERAELETGEVMWKEKERQINWRIDRWLEVIKNCIPVGTATCMDVLRDQLSIANQEYRELKVEKKNVQETVEASRGRIDGLSRGVQEDFEGERAELENDQVMWEEKERQINWRIDVWLEVIRVCTSTVD